jgi:Ca2+-binding RTX toxin-like protein
MAVTIESFEGLTVTPNSPFSSLGAAKGYLQVGFIEIFEFSSGLRLLDPVPNNSDFGVYVGEFDLGNPDWGLGDHGDVSSATVPHGTAYIGRDTNIDGTLAFGFDTDVYVVGALVDTWDKYSDAITATAYDASGKVISGARIAGVDVADWGQNYISVMSKKPIAKVVFTGDFLVLDQLTFDTSKPRIVNGTKGDDMLGSPTAKKPSDGPDLIFGKADDDTIFGGAGDDVIFGGKGKDKLYGGDGNDALIGGKSNDKMRGGEGQDSFLLGALGFIDKLKDFDPAEDSILLTRANFSELALGTLPAAQFNDGSARRQYPDHLRSRYGRPVLR